MDIIFTERAMSDYVDLSIVLQSLIKKQLKFLLYDLRYPSLRAKKYNEDQDIWQGRINSNYRFYFMIKNDQYVILSITKHSK